MPSEGRFRNVTQQGGTAVSGLTFGRKIGRGPIKGAYAPWSRGQLLMFDGIGGGIEHWFYVLAGDSSPQITDGWAQVQTINRPRRLGFTYVTGYNPIALTVPIQFEALHDENGKWAITPNLEFDIQKLEWMAGRGKLWPAGQAAVGDPPLVTVASYDETGKQTNLIPPNMQYTGAPGDIVWWVAGIDYDDSDEGCVRNQAGDRVRQKAAVSLVQYNRTPHVSGSPSARQKKRLEGSAYQVFHSDQKDDTVAKVVRRHIVEQPSTRIYQQVLALGRQHGVSVRSALQHLPSGTRVYIPTSLLRR
jgi:hypothetical protein